jgi:hypothetical protein
MGPGLAAVRYAPPANRDDATVKLVIPVFDTERSEGRKTGTHSATGEKEAKKQEIPRNSHALHPRRKPL